MKRVLVEKLKNYQVVRCALGLTLYTAGARRLAGPGAMPTSRNQ